MALLWQGGSAATAGAEHLWWPTWLATGFSFAALIAIIVFFLFDHWPLWWQFRLIEARMGNWPQPEETRKVESLAFEATPKPCVLVVVPRSGGTFSKFDVRFIRRNTLADKLMPQDRLNPAKHWVGPDVAKIEAIRVIHDGNELPIRHLPNSTRYSVAEPCEWSAGEPIHFEITAAVPKTGWAGQLTLRPAVGARRKSILRINCTGL